MDIYLTDVRPLAGRLEEGAALLPASRRGKLLNCNNERNALLSLGAGLLLRRFLDITSDSQLRYNEFGKPSVTDGPEFSLTHSGSYAAIAVSAFPVGMDIEGLRTFCPGVADRCFTSGERLWANGDDVKLFELWTLKESVLKAVGRGLTIPMRTFAVRPELAGDVPGGDWKLFFAVHDGHAVSAASKDNKAAALTVVQAAELLL